MPPYNPYLTPQQRQSNEMALQQQINYLQSQLQNLQAQDQMQQPMMNNQMQQAIPQNQTGIGTQIVESFDNILAQSVPMDSNGAIFALKDGSEIQHRKWTPNGQIQITKYKPISEPKDGQGNNSPPDSENPSMGLSDALEGIYGRFDDLSSRLGMLEQSILGVQDAKEREVHHEAKSIDKPVSGYGQPTKIHTEHDSKQHGFAESNGNERPWYDAERRFKGDREDGTEFVQREGD